MKDFSPEEVKRINKASQRYFERAELRDYWLNKPFSDRENAGWYLWRLGLLMCGMNSMPGDRILDFGCGTGWTSIMLARTGAEVVGMDVAAGALDLAREAASRAGPLPDGATLRFEQFHGDRIPAPDGYFDFVVVFEAFHHFPNPRALLDEFHRILSPHGILGFAEPGVGHTGAEISRLEAGQGILEQDVDAERFYRSARESGFREMELFVPGIHPHTLSLPMRRARSFLRGASWLIPSSSIRLSLLTGPIGLLHKGPHMVTSLRPRSLRAEIVPGYATQDVSAGSYFDLDVKVTNPTETVWLAHGVRERGCVRVGAHLMTAEGLMLTLDYGRADLPADLIEKRSTSATLRLRAPAAPGRYVIRLDMVNERICWFEDRGSEIIDVALTVR